MALIDWNQLRKVSTFTYYFTLERLIHTPTHVFVALITVKTENKDTNRNPDLFLARMMHA